MGLFSSRRKEKIEKPEGGKWYKIVNTSAIMGLFVAVGLIVLMITGVMDWSSAMVGLTLGIAIVCFCCILALPWVRRLERKEFKILSYVFLGLVALCCVLWVVADIVIINQYKAIRDAVTTGLAGTDADKFGRGILGALNYLKVTLFITIQFSVASFVATVVLKLRKTLIPFQAITFASYAVCDFWISGLMLSLKINDKVSFTGGDFDISDIFSVNGSFIKFLVSKVMLTILLLAISYVIISNIIIKKQEQRRVANTTEDLTFGTRETTQTKDNEETGNDLQSRLENLKKMYDNKLITQEEYESKKAEILKDF